MARARPHIRGQEWRAWACWRLWAPPASSQEGGCSVAGPHAAVLLSLGCPTREHVCSPGGLSDGDSGVTSESQTFL